MKIRKAISEYVAHRGLSEGTLQEYLTTHRKWRAWGGPKHLEEIDKRTVRAFLDHVHEKAVDRGGRNPGRTHNQARANLHALLNWAARRDHIESMPSFPEVRPQTTVAGRYFLTHDQVNSLYQAAAKLTAPRGWSHAVSIGQHWQTALVLFFNYGMDTGTVFGTLKRHEPLLWRHVFFEPEPPQGSPFTDPNEHGWIFYRRVKTGKPLWRPMNRVVAEHLRHMGEGQPEQTVLTDGSTRPCWRFQRLCDLAGIGPKVNVETGEERDWTLKDLRKTAATHHERNVQGSAVEILAHSATAITYKHYADTSELVLKAILTLPQPSAFLSFADRVRAERRVG